jgi:hypothetical protein
MRPPRALLALLLAALAGSPQVSCSHRTRPDFAPPRSPSPKPEETERTVRQTLVISRDTGSRHDILEVHSPTQPRPIALYLRPGELAALRPVPADAEVEITYWEYPARFTPEPRPSLIGELERVRLGPRLLLDRSRCERHDVKMPRDIATLIYGVPAPEFAQAWENYFPNAALSPGGPVMTAHSPPRTVRYVCPICDEALRHWKNTRRSLP